jgi:PAS domain S-box-containing protein
MRTPTKRSLLSPHPQLDSALILALPFPACIYDTVSNIVFYSNSFFNQENSVHILQLLNKWGYNFLTENDLKILNHKVKAESKLTTRRLYYKGSQVKSLEVSLSTIPGHHLVLFFFTEVWTQETVFSRSVYMEELLQSIYEGIGLIDDKDILTYCNHSFAAFFNKNEEAITGLNILDIVEYPNNSILNLEFENLREFKDTTFELQLRTSDNKNRYILVHAIPRKNAADKYSGAFFTMMDITERVLIERELIVAKDKALDADRLKSSFLANMSHEIRTPMNSIIGFSSMLKRTGLDRKKKNQYLDIIISRGKHLMEILNNIIDISKIEENLIQIGNEECNLYYLWDELKVYYESELIKNNKEMIRLQFNPGIPIEDAVIETDGARLTQIIANLLNNSIKFTESGYIEAGFHLLNPDTLVFYVKDTGIGIPLDKQAIIFDRFRQVDESFTRSYGGTGLGLSICKGLLKLMGGKIWVESDGIGGTTFYFTIPYKKFNKEVIKPEENFTMGEKQYDWSGRKILIIEDDPTSFEFLSEVLQPTHCTVLYANNGVEGLKRFGSGIFDLVLLDIQLPEMDGYQIAKTIRQSNTNIPIIAQTAHAMSDDKQKCLKAGCNEYLTKPVHYQQLLETIGSFFENQAKQ